MEKAEASAGWHPSQEHMGSSSTPSTEVGLLQVPGQPGLQFEALTSKEKGKRQKEQTKRLVAKPNGPSWSLRSYTEGGEN